MITSKLVSGLGNQLFQYAMGRQLSLLNNTSLCLDLSFYGKQNLRSYKLSHYPIRATTTNDSNLELELKAKKYRGFLKNKLIRLLPRPAIYKSHYFTEKEWWVFDSDIWKVKPQTYITGYWQHYKYFENVPAIILSEMRPELSADWLQHPIYQQLLQASESVSIHIRRGDYITDPNANALMGILPVSYYEKAIATIIEKVTNPHFFIFSDDLVWSQTNLKLNGKTTFVDLGTAGQDYIELELMSRCRHHIIANSSFSWWAAYLNTNKEKIVIAPQKWVVPEDVNSRIHLQLPSWIKL